MHVIWEVRGQTHTVMPAASDKHRVCNYALSQQSSHIQPDAHVLRSGVFCSGSLFAVRDWIIIRHMTGSDQMTSSADRSVLHTQASERPLLTPAVNTASAR